MRVAHWLAAVLGVLPLSAQAQAGLPGFDLERLSLNPGGRDSLVLDTGDAQPEGALRVSLTGHYEHDPLVLVVNGVRLGAYVSSRFTTHLGAAYGLSRFAEVGLEIPVVTYQSGDDLSARGYGPPPPVALGAPIVQGRFALLQEARDQPIDLTAAVGLALPLGSSAALTRDPGAGLAVLPRLGVGRRLGWVRLGAEAGAVLRGGAVLSPSSAAITDEVGSLLTLGVAFTSMNEGPRGELTVRGTLPFTRSPPSLEILAGVRLAFLKMEGRDQLEAFVMGGPGIGHLPGTPAFRLLAGLAWTPRLLDASAP